MPIKILVADSSESAIRIARSIYELGYVPIGLHTDRDVLSPRRRVFKYDVKIPSFNDLDSIIKVAEDYGVDAIHPGCNYLGENTSFVKKINEKGFMYIGTALNVLEKTRNRLFFKKYLSEAQLPTLDWITAKDVDDIYMFGRERGYPLLLRTIYGGAIGVVYSENSVKEFFEKIRSDFLARESREFIVEAVSSDYKYIEIQLISDGSNTIHLYERDSSLFFNNRVILCEAPAPVVDNDIRNIYLEQAIRIVKDFDFIGVCNIGLLYSIRSKKYFFTDFTPRLKREHYVTEEITGIDIVKKQISIVFEKKLDVKQNNIAVRGHGITVYVDNYNPFKNKYSSGFINYYSEPSGMGIRVESIVDNGVEVNPDYNDILCSITVWGYNRYEALHRLDNVLEQHVVSGIETNTPFIKSVISHPVYRKGYYFIDFIHKNWSDIVSEVRSRERLHTVILLSALQFSNKKIGSSGSRVVRKTTNHYADTRMSNIKRKAWFYWVRLRRRVGRK